MFYLCESATMTQNWFVRHIHENVFPFWLSQNSVMMEKHLTRLNIETSPFKFLKMNDQCLKPSIHLRLALIVVWEARERTNDWTTWLSWSQDRVVVGFFEWKRKKDVVVPHKVSAVKGLLGTFFSEEELLPRRRMVDEHFLFGWNETNAVQRRLWKKSGAVFNDVATVLSSNKKMS